ncbi:hypothetical protein FSPOR_8394 [Fusarium sporotrichioides]|uniref:Uncharacterized protein n=1 Tax=Fusarium sporotrichioides TaxID=5514 RepID=A0A395RUP3_FUSSP|nr:hypothetical protein FSPOR_8394 [Fusarium sporotrichioides]
MSLTAVVVNGRLFRQRSREYHWAVRDPQAERYRHLSFTWNFMSTTPQRNMSYSPRSPGAEEQQKKDDAIWEERIQQLVKLPNPRPRALTPDATCLEAPTARFHESSPWFKIPPNVRRDILRLAFGDTRLHLQLIHSHRGDRCCDSSDKSLPQNWRWRSSRCHRLSLDDITQRRAMTDGGLPGPWTDECHDTGAPIGILGWLLSCRQNLDEDHLQSIFNQLSSPYLPALRNLYITLEDSSQARLSIDAIEDYQEIILEYLDSFSQRASQLKQFSCALPSTFFESIYHEATEEVRGRSATEYESYRQVWRGSDGKMTVVRLPYVDNYPGPPHHISPSDVNSCNYWILEIPDQD